MKKEIRVGPVGDVYAWFFIVDGHIVDQGWDWDLRIARNQANEAAAKFRLENEK